MTPKEISKQQGSTSEKQLAHKWKRIEGLPDQLQKPVNTVLMQGLQAFNKEKEKLSGTNLQEFNEQFVEQLKRKWSIETGIIENLYTLDRGTTQILIAHGIRANLIAHDASNTSADELVAIFNDHQEALEGIFDFVKRQRELSVSYIKELHQVFTRHQDAAHGVDQFGDKVSIPLLKGAYKEHPNNPTRTDGTIHEYCPPIHVESEMDQLIKLYGEYQEKRVPPEILAAWLHHRFTQVHPFQDGNGRVARSLASIVLLRAGGFPLDISRDLRKDYIDALEAADAGDLQPLINLFQQTQISILREAFKALKLPLTHAAVSEKLKRRQELATFSKWSMEELTAWYKTLRKITLDCFQSEAETLNKEFKELYEGFEAFLEENNSEVIMQIVMRGNITNPCARLRISFHTSEGAKPWKISAWCSIKHRKWNWVDGQWVENTEHQSGESIGSLCSDFAIRDYEERQLIEERYKSWLEDVLVAGIKQWSNLL